ncbi:Protein of unknown function [Pyronema omphalodes CBS 100304]|uniref:Uncharacterized protein n=1 Tax=Pyronema omphalodes (strain CBS 100304) TaxID=1076935 RepID=U4LLA4_PYROM|nr:Protein of unknown function [Pyronema omphalodes CBS 100304]
MQSLLPAKPFNQVELAACLQVTV